MLRDVALSDDLSRIGSAAAAFAGPGEEVAAILVAEASPGLRTFLCAFTGPTGRTWLALDENGAPVTSRNRVREAVSIAAMCELAEENAGGGELEELRRQLVALRLTENPPGVAEAEAAALELESAIGTAPRVATPEYLDTTPRARARGRAPVAVRDRDAPCSTHRGRPCARGGIAVQASSDMTSGSPAIRASDAEREHAVERLRAHAVDGRLTLEEFAQRIDSAYVARTRDELDELMRDLPETTSHSRPVAARTGRRWVVAILGGSTRRGRFRLAAETHVLALLGGADLDLRQAQIESPDSSLTAVAVLGGVNIVVPEGVDVDVDGIAILGGKDYKPGKTGPPPGAPRLRIRAFALLGGVEVTTKPPAR
jgi:hypothetical protein